MQRFSADDSGYSFVVCFSRDQAACSREPRGSARFVAMSSQYGVDAPNVFAFGHDTGQAALEQWRIRGRLPTCGCVVKVDYRNALEAESAEYHGIHRRIPFGSVELDDTGIRPRRVSVGKRCDVLSYPVARPAGSRPKIHYDDLVTVIEDIPEISVVQRSYPRRVSEDLFRPGHPA
jgi:hypothetical protein